MTIPTSQSRSLGWLACAALLTLSCGQGAGKSVTTDAARDTTGVPGGDAAPIADARTDIDTRLNTGACAIDASDSVQVLDVTDCSGLAPGTEACHARIFWDSTRCCAGQPCDRLVTYFAGGE